MAEYKVHWVAENLAVGHAPMSYEDLDAIKVQGVDAIVNLCAEYVDLADIERDRGFEVLYLPVEDGDAPSIEELEKGLEWLDEAVHLGKKVLVHCRNGVGRTGTFVTGYLLRRGFGIRKAEARLRSVVSAPSSFFQWRLLRKYGKKSGTLTIREPYLESGNPVNLAPHFAEYEGLISQLRADVERLGEDGFEMWNCGDDTDECCRAPISVCLIEAAYMNYVLNRKVTQRVRTEAMARADAARRTLSERTLICPGDGYTCPLSVQRKCICYRYRPAECVVSGIRRHIIEPAASSPRHSGSISVVLGRLNSDSIEDTLHSLSQRLFFGLTSSFLPDRALRFPFADVVSGRFVETYFRYTLTR